MKLMVAALNNNPAYAMDDDFPQQLQALHSTQDPVQRGVSH
jgi:hypothetical protein